MPSAASSQPFADRRPREVLELTSRVSTDKVAEAKEVQAKPCANEKHGVDVVWATNMISVGLDIGRLGLMLVHRHAGQACEQRHGVRQFMRLAWCEGEGTSPAVGDHTSFGAIAATRTAKRLASTPLCRSGGFLVAPAAF